MKWLSNTYDPRRPDAWMHVIPMCNVPPMEDETREEAWANYSRWLHDKVIGPPLATEVFSVFELQKMGLVGVYAADDETINKLKNVGNVIREVL